MIKNIIGRKEKQKGGIEQELKKDQQFFHFLIKQKKANIYIPKHLYRCSYNQSVIARYIMYDILCICMSTIGGLGRFYYCTFPLALVGVRERAEATDTAPSPFGETHDHQQRASTEIGESINFTFFAGEGGGARGRD